MGFVQPFVPSLQAQRPQLPVLDVTAALTVMAAVAEWVLLPGLGPHCGH